MIWQLLAVFLFLEKTVHVFLNKYNLKVEIRCKMLTLVKKKFWNLAVFEVGTKRFLEKTKKVKKNHI